MSALTEFLVARITEREAVAHAAAAALTHRDQPDPDDLKVWRADDGTVRAGWTPVATGERDHGLDVRVAEHIASHDPARVLAECAAHRAIVERCGPYDDIQVRRQTRTLAGDVLRALAAVYSDHEDFDPAWKV
ncbi:DUF6221 family protein [Georgenia faecalis]|uniref:DUF6221 family protein n=1 Tax=Georgenia faecalis TaxID=2483799 RepID=UPI000FDB9483|nr:DUF6221 family protein [Georgenia faecalis]